MLSLDKGIAIAHIIPSQKYNRNYEISDDEENKDDIGGLIRIKKKKKKYNKPKNLKYLQTIYVKVDVDEEDEAEIKIADPSEIIYKEDWKEMKDRFKLNKYQINQIKDILPKILKIDMKKLTMPPMIMGAIEYIIEMVEHRLKTEMRFYKDVELLPAIDCNKKHTMCNVYITGNSGCGKSSMINKLTYLDKKKRNVHLFTRINNDDASLRDIKETGRLNKINTSNMDDWLDPADMRGDLVVFDDIDSHPLFADDLRCLRNDLLETGRHQTRKGCSLSVISVSHAVSDYNKTKTCHRESAYCVLFPSSNKYEAHMYLKEKCGMPKKIREKYITQSIKDGRYMVIRTVFPQAIITQRSIFLI